MEEGLPWGPKAKSQSVGVVLDNLGPYNAPSSETEARHAHKDAAGKDIDVWPTEHKIKQPLVSRQSQLSRLDHKSSDKKYSELGTYQSF